MLLFIVGLFVCTQYYISRPGSGITCPPNELLNIFGHFTVATLCVIYSWKSMRRSGSRTTMARAESLLFYVGFGPVSHEKWTLNCKNKRSASTASTAVEQAQVVQFFEGATGPEVLFLLARVVAFFKRLNNIQWETIRTHPAQVPTRYKIQ